MHILRAPLNHLLKKYKKWNWTEECEKAFKKLKISLTSNVALTHYNPNKQIYVASNASNFGLGQLHFTKKMANYNRFNMYRGRYFLWK